MALLGSVALPSWSPRAVSASTLRAPRRAPAGRPASRPAGRPRQLAPLLLGLAVAPVPLRRQGCHRYAGRGVGSRRSHVRHSNEVDAESLAVEPFRGREKKDFAQGAPKAPLAVIFDADGLEAPLELGVGPSSILEGEWEYPDSFIVVADLLRQNEVKLGVFSAHRSDLEERLTALREEVYEEGFVDDLYMAPATGSREGPGSIVQDISATLAAIPGASDVAASPAGLLETDEVIVVTASPRVAAEIASLPVGWWTCYCLRPGDLPDEALPRNLGGQVDCDFSVSNLYELKALMTCSLAQRGGMGDGLGG